ncbi:hypothetical protein EXN66_Car005812 [Channa argus]|uniref:Uncharacterized protein n=1 Tax=Channa argus TaxID=215402 RepID=A0A6G1PIK9_CHAAH|nr:hypothetical protein EXN66_Car005812 [Channa argus]
MQHLGSLVAPYPDIEERKTVTAAELKDFEKQAKCFGWYKPQFFNTDHGYENCKSLDDVSEVESEKNY